MKRWRGRQEPAPEHKALLVTDASVPQDVLLSAHELCLTLADTLGQPVTFAVSTTGWLGETIPAGLRSRDLHVVDTVEPTLPSRAPTMSSAPFVYRDDGRPDWGGMWTSFCELALLGGPPHRGEDSALGAVQEASTDETSAAVAEIRRGIWETTGLVASVEEPGWITVKCDSKKMAAWLCAAIILENVEARFHGTKLFLPASAQFALKDQVKSVITVLAKTNHYWQQHIKSQAVACDTVALVMRQQETAATAGFSQ